MRVLVTGGAGFIGSHVVDALLAAGHDVAIIDNLWPHGGGRRANIDPRAKFHHHDIRDEIVDQIFGQFRPEVVSHHAAQHSVAHSTKDPGYDADVNVRGFLNIMQSAVRHGARKVIYASSAATYGTPRYLPMDEAHPQAPESPYGITKMMGEHYLRYYATLGVRFTALRYGNVYGPRQDPNGEAGVIAIFSKRILNGESIRIDWDGEQSKDYVYVGDIVAANLAALERGDDDIVNIGTGVGTSVNALHAAVIEAVGHDVEVQHAPRRAGDVRECVFAIDKAARVLDWRPRMTLPDGIAQTVDYFKAQVPAKY